MADISSRRRLLSDNRWTNDKRQPGCLQDTRDNSAASNIEHHPGEESTSILVPPSIHYHDYKATSLAIHQPPELYRRHQEPDFVLYTRRWLILASLALLSMCNAWFWITWSPLTPVVADFWGVSESAVDALSAVFMYIYVTCSFLGLFLMNKIGLRWGLLLGGILNVMGSTIRYHGVRDYSTVYVGTLIAALAQPFSLSTPPLVSANWFGDNERATATAIGILVNQFGTAVGLGSTIVVDFTPVDDTVLDVNVLQDYLAVHYVMVWTALVMVVLFVQDHPPTPPSLAAMLRPHKEDELDEQQRARLSSSPEKTFECLNYRDSIEQFMLRSKGSWPLVLLYFVSIGIYYAIPTFLSQFVPSWPARSRGWLGIAFQFSGMVGSFVFGRVVDSWQEYRITLIVLLLGGFLSLIGFWTLLIPQSVESHVLVFLCIGASGFFLIAAYAVGYELGGAMGYPANEAAVAGILECATELGSFVWTTIGRTLLLSKIQDLVLMFCLSLLVAVAIVASVSMESNRPTVKHDSATNADQERFRFEEGRQQRQTERDTEMEKLAPA